MVYNLIIMADQNTTLSTVRDRLKVIRKYRGVAQEKIAEWVGISKQAWGKKERGEIDGFSPEDFQIILEKTDIDARWLFGQMGNTPIEQADLRIKSDTSEDQTAIAEMIREYKQLKEQYKDRDSLTERVQSDFELRECVELLINNRGQVSRVMGYIDRLSDEKKEPDHQPVVAEKGEAYAG